MKTVMVGMVCLWCLAQPAWAQTSAEGTIRGVVRDQQGGVLSGVTISATSQTSVGVSNAVSQEDGSYRLLALPPGDYTLGAELPGFAKSLRSGVLVRAGLNIGLDIVLTVAALEETVQVVADSPLLEVHRPVQTVNINGELQRALPLNGRKDFTDFLEITPGITARTLDQSNGAQVYMLRGSEIDNHVIQIDGADIGSFRQGLAGQYIGLSTEAIQDTQVKTGGVDASSPLGVGVIVNMTTPTGTNNFTGSAAMAYQSKGWNGNNASANGQSAFSELMQFDASLGGPLVKDRVTWFGAVRYTDRSVGLARTASQLQALSALAPSFSSFNNGGRSTYEFFKVTAQVTPRHQVYAFVQRDFNPEVAGFPTDEKPFNVGAFGGKAVAARWSALWGSSVVMRVLGAYNDKSFNGTFDAFKNHLFTGPQQDTFTSSFVSGGRRTGSGLLGQFGNAASVTVAPTSKLSLQADVSYFKQGWIGSHELQAGVLTQPRLKNETEIHYANDGAALEQRALVNPNDLTGGTVTFMKRVYDSPTVISSSRVAQDHAFYIADDWKLNTRLTIAAGVRADWIRVDDRLYNMRVQNSWEVGPRVGMTYALTGDDRNIVRVNYGRVADLPQPTYLPSAGGNPVGYTEYYDNNLDGTFETVLRSPPVTPEKSNLRVDPKRHQPFIDEWIAGYRRQWPGQVLVDVSVVRRWYRDRPAAVEINRKMDGTAFVGYKDESLNDVYLVTNNTWNTPVYSGLELTVAKQTATFNALGGYTRGFQHLAGTWMPGDLAALIQPTAFANDKGLGSIRGNEPNSLSGTADTRSPSWQKHALRLGGSYRVMWGMSFGSNLVVMSGPYSGPVVTRVASPDPAFGLPIVTLSNGRQVANPLATTVRFAYANRGEGQIKAPTIVVWNVRVAKDVSVGSRRVTVAVDIFNVTNNAADQQFQAGGNQLYSANYAIAADGSFRGQSRQSPRSAEVTLRMTF